MLLLGFVTGLLAVLFVIVSVLMMLVILIQRPKGGGLAGAFGGAGGSAQAAFGAKTGDVLTWVTVVFFVLFLFLAMGLTWSIHAEVEAANASQQKASITPETSDTPDTPDDATPVLDGAEDEAVETNVEDVPETAEETVDAVNEDDAPAQP